MPDVPVLLGDAYEAVRIARAQLDRVKGLQDLTTSLNALIEAKFDLLDAKLAAQGVQVRWVDDQLEILNVEGQWVRGPNLTSDPPAGVDFRWRGTHLDIRGADGNFIEGPDLQGITAVGTQAIAAALFVETEIIYDSTVLDRALITGVRFDDDEETFYVSFIAGNSVQASLYLDGAETFYSCAINRQIITASPFVETETFYTSTIINRQIIIASLFIDNTEAFYASVNVQAVTASLFVDAAEAFYTCAIGKRVSATLFVETDTFYASGVSRQGEITASPFIETETFYASNVSLDTTSGAFLIIL